MRKAGAVSSKRKLIAYVFLTERAVKERIKRERGVVETRERVVIEIRDKNVSKG